MKKIKFWILFVLLPCLLAGLLAGCLSDQPTLAPPEHIVVVITVVVSHSGRRYHCHRSTRFSNTRAISHGRAHPGAFGHVYA